MRFAERVYEEEFYFWMGLPPARLCIPKEEVVEIICTAFNVPLVEFGMNPDPWSDLSLCWPPNMAHPTGRIEMSQITHNYVILHELAHHVANWTVGNVSHRREWVDVYADILAHYRGDQAAKGLKKALSFTRPTQNLRPLPYVAHVQREQRLERQTK